MIELLSNLGLPAVVVVGLVVVFTLLNQYYQHRLDQEREKFASEIETIKSIHSQRFAAIKEIDHYIADFRHYIFHIKRGHSEYKESLEEHYKKLRALVRENILLLGDEFEPAIYSLTDSGRAVLDDKFDEDQFYEAHTRVRDLQDQILGTIPQIPKSLVTRNIKKEQKGTS